jgi:hypothetical protein
MAMEKEIDLYNSDDFDFEFVDESEETIKNVLDEGDYIHSLKKNEGEFSSPSALEDPRETQKQDEYQIDMPSVELDDLDVNSRPELETEILLKEKDEPLADPSVSADAEGGMPDEVTDPWEDDPDNIWGEDEKVALPAVNQSDADGIEDEADADELLSETEAPTDDGASDINSAAEEKLPAELAAETNTEDSPPLKEVAQKIVKEPEIQQRVGKLSAVNKIGSLALIGMVIVGFFLYFKPDWIELTKIEKIEPPAPGDSVQPVTPAPQPAPVTKSAQSSKRDRFMAILADAVQLRNELLEKRDEIYELNLHYHNGITELENKIQRVIKKENISSYQEAIKNTRINLNMRTIQRRLAYIEELTKPARWLYSGSEELYYLVRKAEVDLQMIEIAGGIDLNKHMRHISGAIQKYSPGPDNLAVDPLQAKPRPLKQIWQQVSSKKEKKIKLSLNPKDEIIIKQICGGNFSRISELTSVSPRAAQCLSRMKGSDLFLNGLKTLSPMTAKQLSQWQGNWICLNGVSQLSESVAQQLFKWKGNWISLNSLNEFPPELAKYLLKWEGQQLELMGLELKNNVASKKTMKYLTLWETTGGKLYVPDQIRQKMANMM